MSIFGGGSTYILINFLTFFLSFICISQNFALAGWLDQTR